MGIVRPSLRLLLKALLQLLLWLRDLLGNLEGLFLKFLFTYLIVLYLLQLYLCSTKIVWLLYDPSIAIRHPISHSHQNLSFLICHRFRQLSPIVLSWGPYFERAESSCLLLTYYWSVYFFSNEAQAIAHFLVQFWDGLRLAQVITYPAVVENLFGSEVDHCLLLSYWSCSDQLCSHCRQVLEH